jgi:hypothetical protein
VVITCLSAEIKHLDEALNHREDAALRGLVAFDAKTASWAARKALVARKLAWAQDAYHWPN